MGKHATEIKLVLTFFILSLLFVQWYGWNEESRFALTRAIVNEGRFEIESWANLTGDRAVFRGKYYSDKDPGLSLLATPIYASWKLIYSLFPQEFKSAHAAGEGYVTELHNGIPILTPVNRGFFDFTAMILLTVLTSGIFAALTTVLVYKISKFFLRPSLSGMLAFSYGIGTLSFPTSLHFWGHVVAGFFAFLSFYIIFAQKQNGRFSGRLLFIAGLAAGISAVIEISTAIIAGAILVYVLTIAKQRWPLFFCGLVAGILPLLLYNFTIFGTPLDLASSYLDRAIYKSAYPLTNQAISRPTEVLQQAVIPPLLRHLHFQAFNPWVALRLLFYPYRGLFFYSPLLLLALIGPIISWKKYRVEILVVLFILLSFVIMLAGRRTWWGGYGFGPRYLVPVMPFLAFLIPPALKRLGLKVFLPLLVISTLINFLGLQPAEDWAYDWNRMDIRSDWLTRLNSFQVLANPLAEHYLPLTLKYGPRSALFEQAINGHISIDPRLPPLSKGIDFPLGQFHIPFLVLLPVSLLLIAIWYKEIVGLVQNALR